MGSPQKRSRRGDDEVRLLIPSKVAGSIIGKGGQNITKLRSQYKASITVPDCPGPERMLTLSSDLDTICNIVNDVVPNLEENGGRVNGNELDLRMMIHQSQAGCVIGKAGYKIKELREKTGARIKIFSNLAPQSTDRIIQIIGEPAKCVDSIREIITLIKSNPIKGIVNPYDPHNYDDYYAEEYGGWGIAGNERRGGGSVSGGGGGANAGNGGPRGGGNRNGFRDGPPARFNSRGPPPPQRAGPPPMNFNDRQMGGSMPPRGGEYNGNGSNNNASRPPPFERNGWGAPTNNTPMISHPPPNIMASNGLNQGPLQSPGGLGTQNGGIAGGKTTTQVTIPKDLAGAIIGKGGGRIRKIRQDSGAGITIDEPLPGSNDRIITITGSPHQIQMAQYLLQQSVHNNSDRSSY
jgi:heterogeneous nuclear ribonucleoprotein K